MKRKGIKIPAEKKLEIVLIVVFYGAECSFFLRFNFASCIKYS